MFELILKITLAHLLGVLDIDSERYGNFDETDKKFLSKMLENILNIFPDEKR